MQKENKNGAEILLLNFARIVVIRPTSRCNATLKAHYHQGNGSSFEQAFPIHDPCNNTVKNY